MFRLTFAGLTGFLKYTGDGMVASIPSIPSRFTQDTLTQLLLFAEAFAWTGGASSIEVGLQPWLPMASSRPFKLGDFPWPRPDGGHIFNIWV